jgi:hypothetical protein
MTAQDLADKSYNRLLEQNELAAFCNKVKNAKDLNPEKNLLDEVALLIVARFDAHNDSVIESHQGATSHLP